MILITLDRTLVQLALLATPLRDNPLAALHLVVVEVQVAALAVAVHQVHGKIR